MIVFFDTSVFVAAAVGTHPQHGRAQAALVRVQKGQDTGYLASHTLAELYGNLTVLPIRPRFRPKEVETIIRDNICRHFTILSPRAQDYLAVIARLARGLVTGGVIYDAMILQTAEKVDYDRFLTLDVDDFQRLAPHLARKIRAP